MLDAAIVLAYLFAVLFVGYRAGKGISTMREYSVSDRNFSNSFMVATLFATWIGGDDLVGVTERIYSIGIIFLAVCWSQILGFLIYSRIVAKKIISNFSGAVSVGEIMQILYGSIGRFFAGVSCIFFSVGYTALQISCMGHLCYTFIGIPHFYGATIGALIIIIYSSFGGIKAVVWTDFLQFGVLIIAIPVITSVILADVGGISALLSKVPTGLSLLDPSREDIIESLLTIVFCIVPIFSPALIQRMLMAKNIKQSRDTIEISSMLYIPFYLVMTLLGFCALVVFPNIDPNTAFFKVVDTYMYTGLRGLAIVGVLAVLMSTADSFMNVATIAAVRDVACLLCKDNLSERTQLIIARLFCIVFGLACLFVSQLFVKMIDFWLFFSNFWTTTVAAPLVLYLFFKIKLSIKKYVISAVLGFVVIIVYRQIVPHEWAVISQVLGLVSSLICGLLMHDKAPSSLIKNIQESFVPNTKQIKKKFETIQVISCIKKYLSFERICHDLVAYSSHAVEIHGAKYRIFGAFSLINYMMPFYMWSADTGENAVVILLIRIIAGIISFILVVCDSWPKEYRKYLPFFTTYMILFEGTTFFWTINLTLAFIMGLLLLDLKSFSIIYPLGAFLAVLLLYLQGYPIEFIELPYYSWYLLVFSIAIIVLFFKDKEVIEKIKFKAVNGFAGAVLHEMKTQIAIIKLRTDQIEQCFEKAKPSIPEEDNLKVKHAISVISMECGNIFNYIKEVMNNLKIGDDIYVRDFSDINVRDLISSVIEQYYLDDQEGKDKINVNITHEFTIHANIVIMRQVIFNILRNALYQIRCKNSGEIFITTRVSGGRDILSIKDTAAGIEESKLDSIFDPFVSDSVGGVGIGLSFCKRAIEDIDGEIYCQSIKNEFTEFIIKFQ